MDKKKRIFLLVLSVILVLVLAVCTVYLVKNYSEKEEMDNLREEFEVTSSEQAVQEVEVPVDFEKLKKANPHIYAWINVPGTKVDYPILRSPDDNAFYLNHTINGQKSLYGSIYTEDYNGMDFMDFNTLLYGHNMKNGTMFGSLKKFRDASFFEENRYINVYMENRILKYEIFAACTWDNKHILATRNFDLETNRTLYIEDIFAVRDMKSQIKKDITVTSEDRLITLSTCMNNDAKRFIVSGVLIYDSANP